MARYREEEMLKYHFLSWCKVDEANYNSRHAMGIVAVNGLSGGALTVNLAADSLPVVSSRSGWFGNFSSLGNVQTSSSSLTNVGVMPLGDRKASPVPPSTVRNSGSPHLTGISQSLAPAGGRSLNTKEEFTGKATLNPMPSALAVDPPKRPPASSESNFLSLLNTKESSGVPFSSTASFRNTMEAVKSPALGGDSFPASVSDHKQRSLSEIEEEERFLYGDEDDKTPEPSKEPPKPTPPPVNVPKNNPDEKEYAKIHDLLKTIGLDIGVAEISKLAVRTQERLHGKKLIPKISASSTVGPQKSTASSAESKSELTVKAEQKPNVLSGVAVKTEAPAKLLAKEKPSPVAQQSGPSFKEETPPVTKTRTANEQSQPTSRAETTEQTISPIQTSSVSSVQVISTVQGIGTVQTPTVATVQELTPPPMSPSQVPLYSPYTTSTMVPNYAVPPPTYNPYGPYVTYPTSSWTLYPPPVHQPPPTHMPTAISPSHLAHPCTHKSRSNLRVIETSEDFTEVNAANDLKTSAKNEAKTPSGLLAKHEAERRNKEYEKLKVLDELEGLKKEVKAKTLNLENLSTKVELLRTQHGILQRKKRREKDGHKDPLLEELNNVLDSARKQISSLNKEIAETKHKQLLLMKVAEILGASPMDLADKKEASKEKGKSSASPALSRDSDSEAKSSSSVKEKNGLKTRQDSKERSDSKKTSRDFSPTTDKKADVKSKSSSKSDSDRKSGEASPSVSSSHLSEKADDDDDHVKRKRSSRSPKLSSDKRDKSECSSPSSSKSEEIVSSPDMSRSKNLRSIISLKAAPKKEDPPLLEDGDIFDYYDSGGHWCEDCNSVCMTLVEYLLHFHERKHSECVKQPKRPWVKKKDPEISPKKKKLTVPLKGAEFIVPTKGYCCSLCYHSFADHVEADEHLRTYSHNEKFKKYTDENINYEVSRRERKKASLSAAQEAARKQAEQKRKLQSEEQSRSKKSKRDHDQERSSSSSSSRRRPQKSLSPVKPEPKRKSKTPEKEPVKTPTFGKFTWKSTENKSQAAGTTQKVEGPAVKEKEEEAKGNAVKPKGIEIKLLGKPSNSQSTTQTTTTSTPPLATSTLTTSSIAASFITTESSSATSTRFKVRPNLPVPLALLRRSSATLSKPAPLNTFLSIKSADATSRSLPVVKGVAQTFLSEDIVSKAFEGEEVVLKAVEETKPEPVPTVNKGNKTDRDLEPIPKAAPQTTTTSPKNKNSDLYDMLFNKKKTANAPNRGAKGNAGYVSKPAPSTKPLSPTTSKNPSQTVSSDSSKLAQSKTSEKAQQEQSTPHQSPGHAAGSRTSEAQSKNVSPEPAKGVAASSANSTPHTQKIIGPLPKKQKGPPEKKSVDKPEQAVSQAGKSPSLSMNPMTGRMEYSSSQSSNPKAANEMKPPETKKVFIAHIQSVKEKKLLPSPVVTEVPPKPSYNPTSKLNQKFKREPLSFPNSFFGRVSDAGCKDIKITPFAAPKPITDKPVATESQPLPSSTSISKQAMQQELDSYYKLIATEEDPEDLVASEDQDTEAEVANAPPKVEVPKKKAKLESLPPAKQTPTNPTVPDIASEDVDDSDMACEVPDGPASNFSTSGLGMVQSSYSFSSNYGAALKQPSSFSRGMVLVDKDYTKKTPTSSTTTSYSMEELEILTTCDSD
ncbi:PREDICTED: zinc finger protein 318 [Nanorana parkeri]|uniref:zinc finger protein 318 n=1 Tax=Nanorana parkeri TaxID=125878 RepID=UPI0008544717|nr:PREDICTED: zinc finger protein 318 [Nanorana parkeri]